MTHLFSTNQMKRAEPECSDGFYKKIKFVEKLREQYFLSIFKEFKKKTKV